MLGAALPALIRDLHTSIVAGRDVAELLDLVVLLHSQATVGWLRRVGGSLDLRSQAAEWSPVRPSLVELVSGEHSMHPPAYLLDLLVRQTPEGRSSGEACG